MYVYGPLVMVDGIDMDEPIARAFGGRTVGQAGPRAFHERLRVATLPRRQANRVTTLLYIQ